ncbi:MAG TPA: hypothetical protein VER55_14480 [Ardenticatenaceae bacterium]|nr:hypothetical protein [Ardenticatenaceae bacterium]
MVRQRLSKNASRAEVLALYISLAVLPMRWMDRRCELAYFPKYGHVVLFCAGVDVLRVWPPFEQQWREPEQDQGATFQAYQSVEG